MKSYADQIQEILEQLKAQRADVEANPDRYVVDALERFDKAIYYTETCLRVQHMTADEYNKYAKPARDAARTAFEA